MSKPIHTSSLGTPSLEERQANQRHWAKAYENQGALVTYDPGKPDVITVYFPRAPLGAERGATMKRHENETELLWEGPTGLPWDAALAVVHFGGDPGVLRLERLVKR